MQDPTIEAFIPTKYVINTQIVGVRMRRTAAKRTRLLFLPAAAAAAAVAVENPTLPPLEDEDLPAAKRPRIQAPISISTEADGVVHAHKANTVTTDSLDDTPADAVTPAASSPRIAAGRASSRHWTLKEDAKLTEAVKKYGKDCWAVIAEMVPGRTNVQCRQRWVDSLDPTIWKNLVKWTPEEDVKLMEAVQKLGKKWVAVAAMVLGRTNQRCRERWVDRLDPTIWKNLGKWESEEDTKLTEAVQRLGKKWAAAAKLIPGLTSEQCRWRWPVCRNGNGHRKKLTEATK